MAGHLILSLGIYDMSPSRGHVQDMSGTFPTKPKMLNVSCNGLTFIMQFYLEQEDRNSIKKNFQKLEYLTWYLIQQKETLQLEKMIH